MAMQDYYEGQVWKQYPGIGKVLLWCVSHTPVCYDFCGLYSVADVL